jgi:hypothetical protein
VATWPIVAVGKRGDTLQQEYDRFGPWALEISDEDPLPALFAPFLTRPEAPLLCVKVPRHIERRDARPGMDLYDYVVALYEEDIVVLRRVGREVRSETCRYQDVRSIRVGHCLLRGDIHLGLADGRSVELAYNTVAEAIMLRLVELVRERYRREPTHTPGDVDPEVPEGSLSFYFDRLLGRLRHPGSRLHLLASQGTKLVGARSMGRLRRLVYRVADKRLLESLHLSDGRELTIIDRGQRYAYRWEAVEYAVETTYLPVAGISGAEWRTDARNDATDLKLRTGEGEDRFAFAADNAAIEAYSVYLAGLPGVAATDRRTQEGP